MMSLARSLISMPFKLLYIKVFLGRASFLTSRDVFLVFCRRDLCEARVNLEICSYLADEPTLAYGPPGQWSRISGRPFHQIIFMTD